MRTKPIMLANLFNLLQESSPVLMMVWALMENMLSRDFLEELFARSAIKQYTRKLLFSDVVAMMSTVVTGVHSSVHEIFQKSVHEKCVSLTSHYNKLNGIEGSTCTALVREVAARLRTLIEQMGATLPALVPGYCTRIVDGNALGGTDHRLKATRDTRSAPLPGKSLVVLDPDSELAIDMIPCEDGHAQERSLFGRLLALVKSGELWIADRNFCTAEFLYSIVERGAAFLIRQHACLRWNALEPLVLSEGMKIAEHLVSIPWQKGEIVARRIFVRLDIPTRDGDLELAILTTLPKSLVDAARVAELYRCRWSIEKFFHFLTMTLRCEVKTMGYPKAALFIFAVALVAANIVSGLRAAIRTVHGREEEEKLSNFHLVRDVQSGYGLFEQSLAVLLEGQASMDHCALTAFLLACARHIRLAAYRQAPNRGHRTKKKRGTPTDDPHVSTARLLDTAQRRAVAL